MAREHLFRGKKLSNGDWVYGCLIQYPDGSQFICVYKDPTKLLYMTDFEVDPDTVCEYTGLKDHNKEKIFEGDKVRIYPDDEIGTIEWSEETARFLIVLDDIVCDFDNFNGYELEIIGNCWDNPELMEAEG